MWRRCPRPFNFTQQQNALRAIDHNHIIMHMDCVCEPSDQNHVVPIGSKGLVWSTMSLSPRSAPRIGVELARCHAGREQIRASPSQIDRSTSASAQRRRTVVEPWLLSTESGDIYVCCRYAYATMRHAGVCVCDRVECQRISRVRR